MGNWHFLHVLINSFHYFYLRLKHIAPALFFFVLIFLVLNTTYASSQNLVAAVKTPVSIFYDGKKKNMIITQNTVEGALEQAGITLKKYDITEPPTDTLLEGQYQKIKVIRALPVLISDNNQEFLAYSAYTNEYDILKQLDITIYPEDKVSSNLITDPADENAIGQKVTILRAPVYTIHLDGEDKIIRSWGKNVGEVLKGKIALGQRDIISPVTGTDSDGVREITITRVNIAEVDETVVIPFETEYQINYNLYKGQTKTIQIGENGQKSQRVKITYHNGIEINRAIISSEITKKVVAEIISRGVKPYNAGMWWNTLVAAGNKYGIDPVGMYNVMVCESGGDPTRNTGNGYYGLFQWDTSFSNWSAKAGYPGASIYNAEAQIYTTAYRVSKNGWSAWGCSP